MEGLIFGILPYYMQSTCIFLKILKGALFFQT